MSVVCLVCSHPLTAHQDAATGVVDRCRVTRCGCEEFAEAELEAPPSGPRRVCVDVPDGYVLSISLIPHQEASDG